MNPTDATARTVAPSVASRLELPLSWERLGDGGAPSEQQRDAADQANATILSFLLQEIELDARPRPTDEQLVEALAPLAAKLDVVVELVTRLSYRDTERPARRALELGERHVAWHAPEAEPTGAWLRLKIYFHPTFLEPVVLFGKVTAADPAAGGGFHIEATVTAESERVTDDLLRLALLTQRRQHAAAVTAARMV